MAEEESHISPELALAELREALGLKCSLSTLHYVLADMNRLLKKDALGR